MPEMISKKLAILKALTTHLEGINPTNSFEYIDGATQTVATMPYALNLSESVYRGRMTFGDEVSAPFLVLLENPRQLSPNSGGSAKLNQDEDWQIVIAGFAEEDRKNPLDPAYQLLAYTQHRMSLIGQEKPNGGRGGRFTAEYRLGGLVGEISYQIPIVNPGKDDVSEYAYFYMPVAIGVVTDLTKPLIQGE